MTWIAAHGDMKDGRVRKLTPDGDDENMERNGGHALRGM